MTVMNGPQMVWAIVDDTGSVLERTVAADPIAPWHRYIQEERAVDREDAVTKVLEAQRRGFSCERLVMGAAEKLLRRVS